MPVWYFLETDYVLNFMDRMRPRLLSIYTFRITTTANRRLGSISGQDETIYKLSSTRSDSVKSLRCVSSRKQLKIL